ADDDRGHRHLHGHAHALPRPVLWALHDVFREGERERSVRFLVPRARTTKSEETDMFVLARSASFSALTPPTRSRKIPVRRRKEHGERYRNREGLRDRLQRKELGQGPSGGCRESGLRRKGHGTARSGH